MTTSYFLKAQKDKRDTESKFKDNFEAKYSKYEQVITFVSSKAFGKLVNTLPQSYKDLCRVLESLIALFLSLCLIFIKCKSLVG